LTFVIQLAQTLHTLAASNGKAMNILVRELSKLDRASLEPHFLALDGEDRRLRFGAAINDDAVRAYVARVDFERDAAFGVFGRGIGGALLARAHLRARNWGVRALFMHCLTENGAMMHLARKQEMRIVVESGEADAWLRLSPADASSHFGEVFAERVALFDYALKQGRAWLAPGR